MPVLRRRDLAASILVAVLAAIQLLFVASSNIITSRELTCAALVLGGGVIILGVDDGPPDALNWLSTILGVVAVTSAALALAGPRSTLLQTISVATILALCCIQLAQHVTFASPDQEALDDNHGSATTARR